MFVMCDVRHVDNVYHLDHVERCHYVPLGDIDILPPSYGGCAAFFCSGVNFGLSDSWWRCPHTPAKGTRPFGNPRFANYF